jgi:hypothetical protein
VNRQKYTNEQMITALKATHGMVYLAADRLGCDPTTVYLRSRNVPAVRTAIENARGKMLDVGEMALMKAVVAGEAWAVCFYLKCQGKNRGYVERKELSGPDGGPAAIDVTTGGKPVDRNSLTADDIASAARLLGLADLRLSGDGGPQPVDPENRGKSTGPWTLVLAILIAAWAKIAIHHQASNPMCSSVVKIVSSF